MQYMALIYGDEEVWAAFSDERAGAYDLYRAFARDAGRRA